MTPPNTQEAFKTILSVMADTSDVSWIFYVIAALQITLFLLGLSRKFRSRSWYEILVGIALLAFPGLLTIGIYFTFTASPPA